MKNWWRLGIALVVAAMTTMEAQDNLHQEDRQALLRILSEVEKAINAQDIEALIGQMHPQCSVTWWNAEISRGHAEIRAYYNKMVKDEGRLITKYTTQAKLGGPARFLGTSGDVAVADGSMVDEFSPVIRGPFQLNSRWSATAAKTADGQWKIATLHLSSNVFTNVLISELTNMMWYAGAAGLALGLAAGFFIGKKKALKS